MEKTWFAQQKNRQLAILKFLRTEVLKSVHRDQTGGIEAALNPFANSLDDLVELGYTNDGNDRAGSTHIERSTSPHRRNTLDLTIMASMDSPQHTSIDGQPTERISIPQEGAVDDDVVNEAHDDVDATSNTEMEMVHGALRDRMRLRSNVRILYIIGPH